MNGDSVLKPWKAPHARSYSAVAEGIGEDKKVQKYMKQKIIKNGVTLKDSFHLPTGVIPPYVNDKYIMYESANWNITKSDQVSDRNIWSIVSGTQCIMNFCIVLQSIFTSKNAFGSGKPFRILRTILLAIVHRKFKMVSHFYQNCTVHKNDRAF